MWYASHVGNPCSHVPLSGDARPAVHGGPPQTTGRNHARCDGAVPLLDPLEHGCPCRGRDLPARIRDGLRVGRQSYQQRMVQGRGERINTGGGSGNVFLVDKEIASTRAEFVKRDTRQVRPMVRCPLDGRARSVRVSRLWIREDADPHAGQEAVGDVVRRVSVISKVTPTSSTWTSGRSGIMLIGSLSVPENALQKRKNVQPVTIPHS